MATYLFDNSKNLVDIDSNVNRYGFDDVKNRLLFSYQEGVYGVDDYKNMVEIKINVGDTVTLDGIECLCIYDNPYLFVDKNHDLVYYFSGNDYINDELPINEIKYGYEWGGYGTYVNGLNSAVGGGLFNTNTLINMNLESTTANWSTLWDKCKEFRQSYSDKWFVPNNSESTLIYNQKNKLNNLCDSVDKSYSIYYQSSVQPSYEGDSYCYCFAYTTGTTSGSISKNSHQNRVRLCRTL